MATATRTSILLVDDDDRFRETLADAMALRDVHVEGATTAQAALARVREKSPSLILLDVQLPDMHGFALCRELRRARYKGPVVFLSAKYTEPADHAEGLLTGAAAYLSKPINIDALWREIRYLLDKPD